MISQSSLVAFVARIEQQVLPSFIHIAKQVEQNQRRVLDAFKAEYVQEFHFAASTGYGYGDTGRDALEAVYARVFGTEGAIVRPSITSGTHAIAASLFGVLRPGDELLYITGKPYDTLEEVIGEKGDGRGSLRDYGIVYNDVPLKAGRPDWEAISRSIGAKTKCIGIQRSRGYSDRPSFTVEEIAEMVRFVKEIKGDVIVFVDNCYGEFVETEEPPHRGADLIAGSLIKNPGGGLAKSGGYIAGKRTLLEQVAARLTAPGVGVEGGAMYGYTRDYFQGFFLAPHVVGEALKGAVLTAAVLEKLGFDTSPRWHDTRTDLIQQINFGSAEALVAFCQGIQMASPIDAHVVPVPGPMPGYEDPVIMAAGTFVQGSTIELSVDGPLRPPHTGYMQGGLTYAHVKIALETALAHMAAQGQIKDVPAGTI
ncbi:methionine gamma-lyase family protein [Numidum massiliense]|uniref:methionine gamma-lyase family protein n=1 Tax=Numidum massiliense TaxID=1522315 RepID=UPI0006D5A110|nr:methionine gamma-lyase family protein [Numidum massiliense]